MRPLQDLHNQALAALAGDVAGTGFAALQEGCGRVEAKIVLLLRSSMALITILAEQRLDLALVVNGLSGGQRQRGEKQRGRAHCQ